MGASVVLHPTDGLLLDPRPWALIFLYLCSEVAEAEGTSFALANDSVYFQIRFESAEQARSGKSWDSPKGRYGFS